MISLHFQLFYPYTNRHTVLILLEVRYGYARGAILVNDNLGLNEYYYYTFRYLLKNCISQSDKYIVYRDEYISSYRITSGRDVTNILDNIVFTNMVILFDTNERPKLNVVLERSSSDMILVGMRDKTLCQYSCHNLELIRVVCFILRTFTMLVMLKVFFVITMLPKTIFLFWIIERMNQLINHRQLIIRFKHIWYSTYVNINWFMCSGYQITVRRSC